MVRPSMVSWRGLKPGYARSFGSRPGSITSSSMPFIVLPKAAILCSDPFARTVRSVGLARPLGGFVRRGGREAVQGSDAGEVVRLHASHQPSVILGQGLQIERAVQGDDARVAPGALDGLEIHDRGRSGISLEKLDRLRAPFGCIGHLEENARAELLHIFR